MIVIRRDLKMRRGKEIAQGAHASMAWITERFLWKDQYDGATVIRWAALAPFSEAERAWLEGTFTKVTCKAESEDQLLMLRDVATHAGVKAYLITDAGRTEFGGVPTVTALAVGPDWADKIDPVTGELELY